MELGGNPIHGYLDKLIRRLIEEELSSFSQVEVASELHGVDKPRAWSKYSSDSSAFQRINKKQEKEVCIMKNDTVRIY